MCAVPASSVDGPVWCLLLDQAGRVCHADPAIAGLSDPARWHGLPLEDLFHPDDREAIRTALRQALDRAEAPASLTGRLHHGAATWQSVTVWLHVLSGASASDRRVLVRLAPEAPAPVEAYDLFFENNPLPMWIYDLETLAFLEVNHAARLQYGYTREEFLRLRLPDIRPEEDVPALMENLAQSRPALEQSGPWRHRLHDGSLIEVDITSHLIEYRGRPAALVVARDVTGQVSLARRLRESEARFRNTFEQAAVGIAHVDLDGRFLRINRRYGEIVGYRVDEMQHLTFQEITHPDDLEADLALVRQLLAGEIPRYSLEKRYIHRQGHPVWVRLTVSLVRTETGAPDYFIAVVEDITARKAAEQALRESESKARAVLDTTADGIITIDEQGIIRSFNRAAERLFGYRAGEVIGRKINLLMPSPYREEHDGYLNRYLTTNQPHIIGRGRDVEGQRKDGSVFPMYLSVSEVRLGEERLFTGIVHDLSERVAVEAELRKRARQQEAVARLGLAAWSLRGNLSALFDRVVHTLVEVLEADLCKVLERMPDREALRLVAGAGWKEGLVGNAMEAAGTGSPAGYALERGEPVLIEDLRAETRFQAPPLLLDHGVVSGISAVIQGEGGPYGVLGVYTRRHRSFGTDDVHFVQAVANLLREAIQRDRYTGLLEQRVRERTAQLEATNRELESFTYSVSHDLRAPLRSMDGFSRVLLERYREALPEEARRYLERIRANATRMGQLIDDLLRFSRLGRQPLERRRVDPASLVRDVWHELRPLAGDRNVVFRVGHLPPCQADPRLLRQVFANLLENALKFTRNREAAHIEVGAGLRDGTPVYYVRDNGAGFDMTYASKLFGVFQRLHRQEEYEGTGVGLAIVQRIVHRHGGHVWAEAAPDQGATFYFTLPDHTARNAHDG
ncbi:PAS domain S-box protein [Rhodocaloribacter litoris]|uniref:PAS domain S-box protein n=1 Tax=Rhodocaloribacter litoris TaxID=2558931 RepID=UPI0014239850|nr:PAS domain S-box protein [Rhodocaloribacter litoris]QXD16330.1 PAS domain S-box protein [Rhodocaloribacter litoris]